MRCWYAKNKKVERAKTKAALAEFIAKVREEALKEASEKAAEETQKESEEEKPTD